MRSLIKAGFQDRIIMFGSDNGDIVKVVAPVNDLAFLSEEQKKILVGNAQKFFLR